MNNLLYWLEMFGVVGLAISGGFQASIRRLDITGFVLVAVGDRSWRRDAAGYPALPWAGVLGQGATVALADNFSSRTGIFYRAIR